MNRSQLLMIVDGHAGGLKGLELMTELMGNGQDSINPVTFFDEIETLIEQEIPELGMLRYGHQIDDNILREKVFVYRKALTCTKV